MSETKNVPKWIDCPECDGGRSAGCGCLTCAGGGKILQSSTKARTLSPPPTCPRCGAPVGVTTLPAFADDLERCYWAAGQRSEIAFDNCARRALARYSKLEAELSKSVARTKTLEDALMEGKTRWPQSLASLEAALSTFPAGREFLRRWAEAEASAKKSEKDHASARALLCCDGPKDQPCKLLPHLTCSTHLLTTAEARAAVATERVKEAEQREAGERHNADNTARELAATRYQLNESIEAVCETRDTALRTAFEDYGKGQRMFQAGDPRPKMTAEPLWRQWVLLGWDFADVQKEIREETAVCIPYTTEHCPHLRPDNKHRCCRCHRVLKVSLDKPGSGS